MLPSASHAPWEEALSDLPKLLLSTPTRLRRTLASLPAFETAELLASADERPRWRAHLLLSFLSHAYVWAGGDTPPEDGTLPARLALPWVALSNALEVPPVLTYATFNLLNWRRLDDSGGIELDNIACLHNFSGGQDEEWFRLVHVAIEARAGDALCLLEGAQAAAEAGDTATVQAALECTAETLRAVQSIFGRMRERCDPYIYYSRVRWPMAGWRNNERLPRGLSYEGVGDAAPRQIYGETGAQSALVPSLDAALGITHENEWLCAYLADMRAHMPREQRAFVAAREAAPPLRLLALSAGDAALREAYNDAVEELTRFRGQHKGFAASFIAQQAGHRRGAAVAADAAAQKGTGGSDFVPALAAYQRATAAAALPPS